VIAALVVLVGLELVSTNAALEKCRSLDREFDTRNMPRPCQAAADDATLPVPDRVEALRRLAFAHILNGDEALAEPAFLKLLVFNPSAELPADAGPRFREIFAEAKKRFRAEGGLITRAAPPPPLGPGPVPVQVDLTDKLGRVVGARVIAKVSGQEDVMEDRLARSELSPGLVRFSGAVPEPREVPPEGHSVSWQIVFDGWDGRTVEASPLVTGSYARAGGGAAGHDEPGGELPWAWIAGGAGGVAVVGAVVGGAVWCYTAGPCRSQDAWVRVQINQGGP
jgi:hypothetical protein